MKTMIVTACGERKNPMPMLAYKLYKSSRIKAVYNRGGSLDMYILSAEYGLVSAYEVIGPYERLMDEQRAEELVPSVAKRIQDYDCVIFFKGGARKAYLSCIKAACDKARKTLVTFGYAHIGGINELPKILGLLREGGLNGLTGIEHLEVFLYRSKRNTD
jgi:hypothetical protein